MTNAQIISWHPDAVLIDRDGMRITHKAASIVVASVDCDPYVPCTALPGFINAITADMTPIMGQLIHTRITLSGTLC